ILHTVVLIGRKQFLRAQNAQNVGQIAADFVLSALASVKRHQERAHAMSTGFKSKQAAVFVVRMGDDLHKTGSRAQPEEFEPQPHETLVLWNGGRNALVQQSWRINVGLLRSGSRGSTKFGILGRSLCWRS
ncbi:MAG TPA: hypothetical protein VNX87_12605, partial [Candidatus Sulfotelmatobacter sp.]|nr:hypothetical protein [Candidatus Sulfotelmatobacter sp.]